MQNKKNHIDVARGLAIILVIIVHTALIIPDLSSIVKKISGLGQLGVQLFFVVSAYTLCLSYDRRVNEPCKVTAFYLRRFFRIAPLYYLGIPIYFTVRHLDGLFNANPWFSTESYQLGNILANLFFIHGFVESANNTIVPGGWSIGTEMAFYLIFPAIYPAWKKVYKNRNAKVAIIMFLTLLPLNYLLQKAISATTGLPLHNNSFLYFNLLNQLPVFLVGITYYLYKQQNPAPLNGKSLLVIYLSSAAMIILAWFSSSKSIYALLPTLSAALFIALLESLANRNVNCSALARIGKVSFSMYIFHFIFAWNLAPMIVNLVSPRFPAELIFICCCLAVLLCTYMIATITEKVIEEKGILIGAVIIKRIQNKRIANSSRSGVPHSGDGRL